MISKKSSKKLIKRRTDSGYQLVRQESDHGVERDAYNPQEVAFGGGGVQRAEGKGIQDAEMIERLHGKHVFLQGGVTRGNSDSLRLQTSRQKQIKVGPKL